VNAGIFVVGAPRSGTSAVTRVVNLLGVSIAGEEELKPPDESNPRGYYESRRLTSFNRRLLVEVGGAPYGTAPRLPAGWTENGALDSTRRKARELMEHVHPTTPWVWKDPRTCLTLPFWIEVADVDPVVVLVYRDPLEVAESHAQRADAPYPVTLGIWERYNRAALVNACGLPTFVVRYERLVESPRPVALEIEAFLRQQGLDVADPGPSLESFVDSELRRARPELESGSLPTRWARAIEPPSATLQIWRMLDRSGCRHLLCLWEGGRPRGELSGASSAEGTCFLSEPTVYVVGTGMYPAGPRLAKRFR